MEITKLKLDHQKQILNLEIKNFEQQKQLDYLHNKLNEYVN